MHYPHYSHYSHYSPPIYCFSIFQKKDEFLATLYNPSTSLYVEQGYIYWGNINATSAITAINEAKNIHHSTINKLKAEIEELKNAYQSLEMENDKLRKNGSSSSSPQSSRHNHFEVLGLPEGSTSEEIKKRHKELSQKMHPDKNGSHYLMTLINKAKEALLK